MAKKKLKQTQLGEAKQQDWRDLLINEPGELAADLRKTVIVTVVVFSLLAGIYAARTIL